MLHSSNRSSAAQVCLCVAALLVSPLFFALTAKAQNTITTVAGGGTNSSVAINAVVSYPTSVAVDSHGNVFVVAKSMNQVYKLDLQGNFTLVAGNGSANYSGDNGAATSASLNAPSSVAVDASGNLFIADSGNSRVRRVDASTGIITTVAGNGTWGYSGDGGPATSAELMGPSGVAVDSSGNLFIADVSNSRIRRVDASTGTITTVAGNGTAGFGGDGGPATSANLDTPYGVAIDGSGNLLIADNANDRIRRVAASTGIITTVAGSGTLGFSGDGGVATDADLFSPTAVAIDSSGNLLIADQGNGRIRQVVTATGIINTVAGNGSFGYSGDNGPATSAALSGPWCVAADASDDLFIADTYNNRIRRVAASTAIITTVAGGGSGGDGGAATSALLVTPGDVGVDSSGNFFVADTDTSRIRRVDPSSGIINTVAGNGRDGFSGDGGAATSAGLNAPWGLAVDGSGNLFIADTADSRVRRVDAVSGDITTVAGGGGGCTSQTDTVGDGCPATSAGLSYLGGVAVDASGNIFIADTFDYRVRRVDASTGTITTVAGNGTWGYSGDGGPATSAELSGPSGVAVDSSGNLFIADLGNSRIRRVDAASHVITTVAGNGTIGSSGDGGPATSAELSGPSGVAVDSSGNLFIADSGANRIRRVDAATGIITTVAGQASWGFSGDGGPATSASLNYPYGVAVDGAGDLLIADTENSRIRQVALVPLVSFSSTNLSFQSQAVGTTSAPQTVTVMNAGGANLTITSIAASSNFAQTNNCPAAPATLNPGSTCTVNVTFTPSTGGSITGTIAVTDNAFDSPEVIALSGTGSDFTLASASGSSTSATVSPGATATYTLAVEGTGGFNQSVSFTCTGAPSESTCTVSPSPVTVGSPATNLKVTVTTTAPSASRPRSRRHPPAPPLLPVQGKVALLALLLAGWAWAIRGWRQLAGSRGRAAIVSMAAGLLLSLVMAACGGGGGSSSTPTVPGTPAGTYTLTVTGTAGSGSTALSHSATLTLTVS